MRHMAHGMHPLLQLCIRCSHAPVVQVMLSLPAWSWLPWGPAAAAVSPAGPALWQFSFKWAVRRVSAALAVAVLSYCWLSYRDYERESFL